MNINCPSCGKDTELPDHKIPKDRDFSFKCPGCGSSVPVKASELNYRQVATEPKAPPADQNLSRFQAGSMKQALVCMVPSLGRNRVISGLENAGFVAHVAQEAAHALRNLEYSTYPLVLVDDDFDADKRMAQHMNGMDMSLRRNICLVQVSPGVETGNAMTALHFSVNYVIRSQDLEQQDASLVDDILAVALSEHETFYAVFNSSMKAAGKA